jgi:hypothetical protein
MPIYPIYPHEIYPYTGWLHRADEANVQEFLNVIMDSAKTNCSELGQLEVPVSIIVIT